MKKSTLGGITTILILLIFVVLFFMQSPKSQRHPIKEPTKVIETSTNDQIIKKEEKPKTWQCDSVCTDSTWTFKNAWGEIQIFQRDICGNITCYIERFYPSPDGIGGHSWEPCGL